MSPFLPDPTNLSYKSLYLERLQVHLRGSPGLHKTDHIMALEQPVSVALLTQATLVQPFNVVRRYPQAPGTPVLVSVSAPVSLSVPVSMSSPVSVPVPRLVRVASTSTGVSFTVVLGDVLRVR